MRSSEVTPRSLYVRRREFLKLGAGSALALSLPAFGKAKVEHGAKLPGVSANAKYALPEEKKTPFEDITTYNNFYEFGTDKSRPDARTPARCSTRPWTVSVEGEVGKPRQVRHRRHPQGVPARGARLPACAASRPGRW